MSSVTELMRLRGWAIGWALPSMSIRLLLAQPCRPPPADLVENAVSMASSAGRRLADSVRCHRIGGLAIDVTTMDLGCTRRPDGGGTGLATSEPPIRRPTDPDATLAEDRDDGGVCASLRWPAAWDAGMLNHDASDRRPGRVLLVVEDERRLRDELLGLLASWRPTSARCASPTVPSRLFSTA